MSRLRVSAIVLISITGAIVAAGALVYPLAKGSWADFQARRAQDRDFVIASDSDQAAIVRSLLLNEMAKPPLCSPSQDCPKQPIYFDRLSATLRSTGDHEPWAKYEIRTVRPDGSLVNRGDNSLPIPLQELLDQISQRQTYNADPMLSGVVYVAAPEYLPVFGEPDSCDKSIDSRLVRISNAAVQESTGIALALIARTFCDGTGVPRVATLQRDGAGWRVLQDY